MGIFKRRRTPAPQSSQTLLSRLACASMPDAVSGLASAVPGAKTPPAIVRAVLEQVLHRRIPVTPEQGVRLFLNWMHQQAAESRAATRAYHGWFARDEVEGFWLWYCDEAGVEPCPTELFLEVLRGTPGVRYKAKQRLNQSEFAPLLARQQSRGASLRPAVYYLPSAETVASGARTEGSPRADQGVADQRPTADRASRARSGRAPARLGDDLFIGVEVAPQQAAA